MKALTARILAGQAFSFIAGSGITPILDTRAGLHCQWRQRTWRRCRPAQSACSWVLGYLANRLDGLHVPAVGISAYRDPAASSSNGPRGDAR